MFVCVCVCEVHLLSFMSESECLSKCLAVCFKSEGVAQTEREKGRKKVIKERKKASCFVICHPNLF